MGAVIAVEVSGDDFDEVGEAAMSLRRALLKEVDGIELPDDYKVDQRCDFASIEHAQSASARAPMKSLAQSELLCQVPLRQHLGR